MLWGNHTSTKERWKKPLLPGNYRPISLLSIFYKLASATITRRIKPVLSRLVGIEQKAYLSEDNIGSVIINIINIIDFCNKKQKDALILLVDFQKAFDSISHSFIDSTLKFYGGTPVQKILLWQGVPQGDVISPYIFLLSVEILALKIKHTKHLTGITYAQREARAEIFADDLSAMVERSEKNLRNFTRILVLFHSVSGLKCNLDKTFVVPVGNFRKADMCSDLDLKWVDEFKVLGIVIDNKLKKLRQNFKKIERKMETKLL